MDLKNELASAGGTPSSRCSGITEKVVFQESGEGMAAPGCFWGWPASLESPHDMGFMATPLSVTMLAALLCCHTQ